MFKPLFAAAAALVCMTGDVTVGQAHARGYQIACGENSSVLEISDASMQIHRGGGVTFWSYDSSGSLMKAGLGTWTSSRNGDIRVTANETGRSHVFDGFFNAKCDWMF